MSKRINNKKGKLGRSPKFNKHRYKQICNRRNYTIRSLKL